MFNAKILQEHYLEYAEIPHASAYRCESYYQHAMLAISQMAKRSNDSVLLLAVALHDVAKPRSQSENAYGFPSFYGHSNVTDEELSKFLSLDDPRFEDVKGLVKCHMLPYKVERARNYRSALQHECRKVLEHEPTEGFMHRLELLHEVDELATLRTETSVLLAAPYVMEGEAILTLLK